MTKELREIMRHLDQECGIVDEALVTPPEPEGLHLEWGHDFGIPILNERAKGKHWTEDYASWGAYDY